MPLHPMLQAMHDASKQPGAPAFHELPIDQARALYRAMGTSMGPTEEVGAAEDRELAVDGGSIRARVYRPKADGTLPAIVYFHGGGFVIGDLDSHDPVCRALCNLSGCAVVSIEYRLGPEHPLPTAFHDAAGALRWVAREASSLDIDAARLAVVGDSAGGTISAWLGALSRDGEVPAVRFQGLIYPWVDSQRTGYASYAENADMPFLPAETVAMFEKLNGSTTGTWRNGLSLAPLRGITDRSGLPPATVITAEYDLLRDQGAAYAKALEEAGVEVTYRCYEGMSHAFVQLCPILPEAREALGVMAEAVKQALE